VRSATARSRASRPTVSGTRGAGIPERCSKGLLPVRGDRRNAGIVSGRRARRTPRPSRSRVWSSTATRWRHRRVEARGRAEPFTRLRVRAEDALLHDADGAAGNEPRHDLSGITKRGTHRSNGCGDPDTRQSVPHTIRSGTKTRRAASRDTVRRSTDGAHEEQVVPSPSTYTLPPGRFRWSASWHQRRRRDGRRRPGIVRTSARRDRARSRRSGTRRT